MSYEIDALKKQRMLTIKEAQFYLGYGKSKVYQLVETGELDATNDGTIRIFRDSCDRYQKRYGNNKTA